MLSLALHLIIAGAGLVAIAAIVHTIRECLPALRRLYREL